MKKIILFLILLNLVLMACKKDKPHNTANTVSIAEFAMYDGCLPYGTRAYDDTIIGSVEVNFVAQDSNATSYLWRIGAKTYNTRDVCEYFGTVVSDNHRILDIPVTLKVTHGTTDSVIHVVHFQLRKPSRLTGAFKGYRVNDPYRFYNVINNDTSTSWKRPNNISNLMNMNDTSFFAGLLGSNCYSTLGPASIGGLWKNKLSILESTHLEGRIDQNNNIVINFEYHVLHLDSITRQVIYGDTLYKTGNQTFIGKKIK